jgi:hypothetical protein
MSIENRATWMELKIQGWSYGRIAKQSGVSRQRVQQILSPPKSIRAIVSKRANYACERCSAPLLKSGHVHHSGGADDSEHYEDIENLQYLCQSCHWHAHGHHQNHAKGPTVMPRKPKNRDNESDIVAVYFRLKKSVRNDLAEMAGSTGQSMQVIAERAIEKELTRLKKPRPEQEKSSSTPCHNR